MAESIISSVSIGYLKTADLSNSQKSDSLYDLDIEVNPSTFNPKPEGNQLITSKSLCTPGCGNTGTGNSFCC